MTLLDQRMRPLAQSLIKRYGASVVYGSAGNPTYNTATSQATPNYQYHSVKAVVGTSGHALVDGMMVRREEIPVTVAAIDLPFTPKVGDVIRINSVEHRVVGFSTIYSGELPAVYELEVKR